MFFVGGVVSLNVSVSCLGKRILFFSPANGQYSIPNK